MELVPINTESISYSELTVLISNFKEFLATSTLVVNSYKHKPKDALELLTYTLYFVEQVQKKNETDIETNIIIYQNLVEINSLWRNLLC